MSARTVTETFGRETADELAALAIDILCSVPEKGNRYASDAKVRWSRINEGRAILERAGIDWRGLVKIQEERSKEARERVHASRRKNT